MEEKHKQVVKVDPFTIPRRAPNMFRGGGCLSTEWSCRLATHYSFGMGKGYGDCGIRIRLVVKDDTNNNS